MSEFRDVMKKYHVSSVDVDHMAAQLYIGDIENPLDYVEESLAGITTAERKILVDLVTRRKKELRNFFYTNFLPD